MSPSGEQPAPPAGEEIHLPGGSIQPLLLTAAITLALVGITVNDWLMIGGIVVTVLVIARWIADVRSDMSHLPESHGDH